MLNKQSMSGDSEQGIILHGFYLFYKVSAFMYVSDNVFLYSRKQNNCKELVYFCRSLVSLIKVSFCQGSKILHKTADARTAELRVVYKTRDGICNYLLRKKIVPATSSDNKLVFVFAKADLQFLAIIGSCVVDSIMLRLEHFE